MRLVADVGGSNTRLALSQAGLILSGTVESYANAEWDGLYDVIDAFLARPDMARPSEMVIAVAGPVHGDHALLTNRNWTIETMRLARDYGCRHAYLLNDLTALGYAVPVLRPDQLCPVHAGAPAQTGIAQSLVVGIGTGFNVSPVLQSGATVLCPAAEAGHITMPHGVVAALAAASLSGDVFPTVETLFSGRGLTEFCQRVTGREGMTGAEAIAVYGRADAEHVTAAIDLYSALLGWLLRDLTLSYMCLSGIYLAGSVARAVAKVSPHPCIEVFQRPCRIRKDAAVPIWTIRDDGAALFGCAGYAPRR